MTDAIFRDAQDLTDLLRLAEPRRAARAASVNVAEMAFEGETWEASVEGSTGRVYTTRIHLGLRRTYSCTCPDHGRRGPCKHVVALAREALEEVDTILSLAEEPRC
jgi:uncharacterized Zn finger protein